MEFSPEKLREYIKEGYCPWCGKGGWERLPCHTKAHGISAADIKEMAGLLKHEPTCTTEQCREMADTMQKATKDGRWKPKSKEFMTIISKMPRTYNSAGLVIQRQKGERIRDIMANMPAAEYKRLRERTAKTVSRPHDCPVCGNLIPRSKPRCCSPECRHIAEGKFGKRPDYPGRNKK